MRKTVDAVVIMVGTSHPGNAGAAARAAANFGIKEMRFVAPRCQVKSTEALDRSKHAKPLLEAATLHATLKEALVGVSLAVGTTARTAHAPNHFRRKPSDIRDFMEEVKGMEGTLAWVFGPEDAGLAGSETDLLDHLVTIPTATYSSLNLSHAVAVCCYEQFRLQAASITPTRVLEPDALLALHDAWDALVDENEERDWRQKTARSVWRKVWGRAQPDTFEVYNIMGILANALKRFGRPGYQTPASQKYLAEKGKLIAPRGDEEE